MSVLRMNGVRIQNLEEFRRNFDFVNAKDYLYQGRLSVWMREIGENDLADELDDLKKYDYSDRTLADNFKGIFGLKETPFDVPVEKTADIPKPKRVSSAKKTTEKSQTAAPVKRAACAAVKAVHNSIADANAMLDRFLINGEYDETETEYEKPVRKAAAPKKQTTKPTGKVIYEGFFPDEPVEQTQENMDRILRIKAVLKIVGEQALLSIPPKMRKIATAPIKITSDTLLEKICPGPKRGLYFDEDKNYGLVGALNKACGLTGDACWACFKYTWRSLSSIQRDGIRSMYFDTVGKLVSYLSTGEKENILRNYSAGELEKLNREKF